MAAVHNLLNHPIKLLLLCLSNHQTQLVDIRLNHRRQHVRAGKDVFCRLNALSGGQTAPNHLLQGLLHIGIPVVAQLEGKTHHRGLADSGQASQAAGGHKGGLVVIIQNIVCYPALSL